jgi:hypothetical protein
MAELQSHYSREMGIALCTIIVISTITLILLGVITILAGYYTESYLLVTVGFFPLYLVAYSIYRLVYKIRRYSQEELDIIGEIVLENYDY